MAEKFFTTERKKMFATAGLGFTGWVALTSGANPLGLPALPSLITDPLVRGFSILTLAGIITLLAILMIWTEY